MFIGDPIGVVFVRLLFLALDRYLKETPALSMSFPLYCCELDLPIVDILDVAVRGVNYDGLVGVGGLNGGQSFPRGEGTKSSLSTLFGIHNNI